jgi:hypothetical protein
MLPSLISNQDDSPPSMASFDIATIPPPLAPPLFNICRSATAFAAAAAAAVAASFNLIFCLCCLRANASAASLTSPTNCNQQ